MLWVKICGMTSAEDALAAAEAGADAIGMLFAPSKRRVSIDQAKEITKALPKTLEKVGVFYDEPAGAIEEIASDVGLTAVQLHGDETPEFARTLFRSSGRSGRRVRVFKTLHVTDGVEQVAREFLEDGMVDGVLLDSVAQDATTGAIERGGTGQTFDWKSVQALLPSVLRHARIIVAGGLTSANVGAAVRILRPWGVDVCSGVEREPGKKDLEKVREFVASAHEAADQFARGAF
jgi:phosphoribosylanthranilate isomerase